MIHACSHLPIPDGATWQVKLAAWVETLAPVPPLHFRACYERACERHTGQFAPTAYEIRQAWLEVGPELAELAARRPPVGPARQLPAAPTGPLAESNTVEGVLADLAHAWGEWPAEGLTAQVLTWGRALRTAYPEIPPAAMRLQLHKLRLAGAASLSAAVGTLLTEAAPEPQEAI